jgi:sialate O-acetylesterase
MQWPLKLTDGAQKELAELNNPRLFLYSVRRFVSGKPLAEAKGKWQRVSPENAANFSAVAYYFGKALRESKAIPIGLIHASWGGTPAESWTTRATLEKHHATRPIVQRWDKVLADHPAALAAWRAADKKTRAKRPPVGPRSPHRASGLFNGMIAPVIPYAIKGVIWYQGESNAGRAEQYRTLFPAMIRDWRAAWGQGDFPFLFVQLANFGAMQPQPGESAWAELREAQTLALKEPNTGMAVTIDIGAARDIHPRNKRDVGQRLAMFAMGAFEPAGPLFSEAQFHENEVTLQFQWSEGLRARRDDPLFGFAIAGADKKFYWAHARIEGETVVVSHPRVKKPAAVRYAWADNPHCNLENRSGIPASPFRTDTWPGVTAGKR